MNGILYECSELYKIIQIGCSCLILQPLGYPASVFCVQGIGLVSIPGLWIHTCKEAVQVLELHVESDGLSHLSIDLGHVSDTDLYLPLIPQ